MLMIRMWNAEANIAIGPGFHVCIFFLYLFDSGREKNNIGRSRDHVSTPLVDLYD